MDKTNEQNSRYDYLIVGAGLFGAVCAWKLKQLNKKVLVIDKESKIGGNCYTQFVDGKIGRTHV